jgi:hypothetical protein
MTKRRKGYSFSRQTVKVTPELMAKINAMPRVCAWDGCNNRYQGDQPPDWNCLLVFWSPGPIRNLAEINPNFWPRDGVLCPKHSADLEKLLRPTGGGVVSIFERQRPSPRTPRSPTI